MVEIDLKDLFLVEAALLSSGLFCGVALYVSLIEHPMRMQAMGEMVVKAFVFSYKRAAPLQASLALIASVAGFLLWQKAGDMKWLVGAGCFAFIILYTFVAIMPTNRKLLASPAPKFHQAHPLLVKWGRLHWLRTILSLAGFACFVLPSKILPLNLL